MKSELPPPPESYRRSHKLLAPGLHRLHLSCAHFSDLTLESMDRPLARGERLRHLLHFVVCSMCRKFAKQIKALPDLVRASAAEQEARRPDPEFLDQLHAKLTDIARESDTHGNPNG